MIIISRKIEDKEVSFVYNPKVDGPLEIYKRNPAYKVYENLLDKADIHLINTGGDSTTYRSEITLAELYKYLEDIFYRRERETTEDTKIEIETDFQDYFAVKIGTLYTGKGGFKMYLDFNGPLINVAVNGKPIDGENLQNFIKKIYGN